MSTLHDRDGQEDACILCQSFMENCRVPALRVLLEQDKEECKNFPEQLKNSDLGMCSAKRHKNTQYVPI